MWSMSRNEIIAMSDDPVTCPNCRKRYDPEYLSKAAAPEGSILKEQHITGICSTECWDQWLPGDIQ